MIDAPLALATGTVSVALNVVSAALGFAVGYIAFRGYRRNESRPMLFVAVGFLLVFWTPVFLEVGFVALEAVGEFAPGMRAKTRAAFAMAGEVSRIVGLVCVLYGLRMPLRR